MRAPSRFQPSVGPFRLGAPCSGKVRCGGRPAALSKYKDHPKLVSFSFLTIFPFDLCPSPSLLHCACLLPADHRRLPCLDPAQGVSLNRWPFSLSRPCPSSCWLPKRIPRLERQAYILLNRFSLSPYCCCSSV